MWQARIHPGFTRFMEIGQIFHNKYIFNKKKTFQVARLHSSIMELPSILFEWLRNPGKMILWSWNPKNFPGKLHPDPLEACTFGAHLGNWSVFILVLCLSSVPSASWAIDSEPIWARGIIVKYLCDFAKGCLLSFRLNTGMEKKKKTGGLASC